MKNLPKFLPLLWIALGAGCATSSAPLVLDSVGPESSRPSAETSKGTLVVFSALNVHPNSDPSDESRHYSDYEIWSRDGSTRLQQIRNYSSSFSDEAPTKVELPPGEYLVKAVANAYRLVNVPVVIAANRVTSVHLDGETSREKSLSSSDKVYLPDGEIVGYRAVPDLAALAPALPR